MPRKVEQGKKMSSLQDNKIKNLSFPGVLKSISDDKSLSIFQLIADVNSNGEIILKKLGLTRKQYYSKISTMMKAGLIKKTKWKISSYSFWQSDLLLYNYSKKSSRQLLWSQGYWGYRGKWFTKWRDWEAYRCFNRQPTSQGISN